jgi:hypothetical protein
VESSRNGSVTLDETREVLTVPGKIVSFVSENSELLKVLVEINNQEVLAVIDSGAVSSLISEALVKELRLPVIEKRKVFNVIGKNDLSSIGEVKCSCSIHGVQMTETTFAVFPVVSSTSVQLVLGIDFLKNNLIEFCVKQHLLIKHFPEGGSSEIYLDGCGKPKCVIYVGLSCMAAADIKFEPGKIEAVPLSCCMPCLEPDHLFMYSDESMDHVLVKKLRGLAGISCANSKHVLMVADESSVAIRKGQVIGTMSSVVQLPESVAEASDYFH